MSEKIEEKLDTMITLLALDKKSELEESLEELDSLHTDILKQTENWTSPADFKEELSEEHDVSKRTVTNKISDLVEEGLLRTRGSAQTKEYKRASFFDQVSYMEGLLEG